MPAKQQFPLFPGRCKGRRGPRRRARPVAPSVGACLLLLLAGPMPAQETPSASAAPASRRWFPGASLAPRLRAPPRETRVEGGVILVDRHARDAQLGDVEALVAFGYRLAVIRFAEPGEGRAGLDLSLDAGVFTRFSPEASALGLIEADFRVGFPVGVQIGPWEARVGWVHSSSHLGDDFLREFPGTPFDDRISRNGFELLLVRRLGSAWKAYAGADLNYDTTPTLESVAGRIGWEWEPLPGAAAVRPNVAFDLEWTDLTERLAGTGSAGVLFRTRPVLQLDLVGHFGPSPMGHFRLVDENYVGLVLTIRT